MAKASKREYVWLECTECGDRNYRTEISVVQGAKKVEIKKFCRRDRKRTLHKVKKK
ncbi:MAG: 50S ribosomal protein L33 [Planctomycetes bacterium GWC2_49_10]|nr:MAG: 50S ribosomal protein L33 [Planctomycetes bacterium GWC2_49_10]